MSIDNEPSLKELDAQLHALKHLEDIGQKIISEKEELEAYELSQKLKHGEKSVAAYLSDLNSSSIVRPQALQFDLRIKHLQDKSTLTPGEIIELTMLLNKRWS